MDLSVSIVSSTECIIDIFNQKYSFIVPPIQRPYCWTKENALELLSDLWNAFNENNNNYFLGSFVTSPPAIDIHKRKSGYTLDIIDGQQRLTTITILLALLDHFFPSDYQAYVIQKTDRSNGLMEHKRILYQKPYGKFMEQHIQNPKGFNEILQWSNEKISDLESEPEKHLVQNSIAMYESIQYLAGLMTQDGKERDLDMNGDIDMSSGHQRIVDFGQFLLSRCAMIHVRTSNQSAAFMIFATLNTRGLALSEFDQVKVQIINDISNEDTELQQKISRMWDDWENIFSTDFSLLIKSLLSISQKEVFRKKSLIENSLQDRKFVVEHLDECAEFFKYITRHSQKKFDKKGKPHQERVKIIELNNWINYLNLFPQKQWVPRALLIFQENSSTDLPGSFTARILSKIKALAFYTLSQLVENKKDTQVTTPHTTAKALKNAIENYDIGRDNLRAKFCLLLIEYLYRGKESTINFCWEEVTLEHILPENPRNTHYWKAHGWEKEIRERYVYKLGNLALLNRKANSSANNAGFDVKLKRYCQDSVPSFVVTQMLMDPKKYPLWTRNAIDLRTQELLDKIAY